MKYRKKPVVIEAWEYNKGRDMPEWVAEAVSTRVGSSSLFVKTLEGEHEAKHGDFLIQGVKGEVYPCKPDIFAMTYDKVEDNVKIYPEDVPGHKTGESVDKLRDVLSRRPER